MNIIEIERIQAAHMAKMQKESPRFARHLAKAWKGKSRISLIKCFCLECQGRDGDAVDGVRYCTSPTCPLFNARPFQSGGED